MPSLEEIAETLGGRVRAIDGNTWLDTTAGEFRAVVIRRIHPGSNSIVYDVGVFLPAVRDADPFVVSGAKWQLRDGRTVPRLGHGYLFAECRNGMLLAAPTLPGSIEGITCVLWELAAWARESWHPVIKTRRRRPSSRFVALLIVVALVSLIVLLVVFTQLVSGLFVPIATV